MINQGRNKNNPISKQTFMGIIKMKIFKTKKGEKVKR